MPYLESNLSFNADSMPPSLGAVVRSRRRALRLTQEDLADIAGVGLRLVHEVEHDKDTVRLNNLVRLLRALGLHLELAPGAADHVGSRNASNAADGSTK